MGMQVGPGHSPCRREQRRRPLSQSREAAGGTPPVETRAPSFSAPQRTSKQPSAPRLQPHTGHMESPPPPPPRYRSIPLPPSTESDWLTKPRSVDPRQVPVPDFDEEDDDFPDDTPDDSALMPPPPPRPISAPAESDEPPPPPPAPPAQTVSVQSSVAGRTQLLSVFFGDNRARALRDALDRSGARTLEDLRRLVLCSSACDSVRCSSCTPPPAT